MFISFQFMLKSIFDLIERIEKNILDANDRDFLINNINLFYQGFLFKFVNRIIDCYEPDSDEVVDLKEIQEKIDKKLKV